MHIINSLSLASYNRSPKIVSIREILVVIWNNKTENSEKQKLSDNYQGTRTASGYAAQM